MTTNKEANASIKDTQPEINKAQEIISIALWINIFILKGPQ